jgi:nucleotide-binding universal stress UspA family protein
VKQQFTPTPVQKGPAVFEKIVIGYTGDQAGRDAVTLGGAIAGLFGSAVVVVFPYRPLLDRESADVVEQRVRDEVAGLSGGIDASGAVTYHWTPSSWPIHGLHEMARYDDAQLIVLGSACEGLADNLRVSLMERMVHGAPCAVAVAPPHYAETSAAFALRVGVGFSATEEGIAAVHVARDLAARAGGRLSVIAGAGVEPMLASYVYPTAALPEYEQAIYEETRETLERVTDELGDEVPVQRETIRGDAASVLIERSGELDILVLGSRAYGPLRYALLGGVSARVMREARCPVLVLPRGVPSKELLAAGSEAAGA